MLLLCSNGLSSKMLQKCISDRIQCGNAAVVVTADCEYKAQNYHVPRCREECDRLGLEVDLFDIDFQPIEALRKYDLVEFIGGNPYYLLHALKRRHAGGVLSHIASEKILVGWSAGALVMGPTLRIVEEFSPEMNLFHLKDLSGMGLTEVQVLPHYSAFCEKYENCEERCARYEQKYGCSVIRISDGDGVLIENGVTILRARSALKGPA